MKSKRTFKLNVILWQYYEHPYANVFSNVDQNSKETLHVCKSCKAMFSNKNLRKAQQKKQNDTSNNDESILNNVPETLDKSIEGRSQRTKRDAFRYLSSFQDPLCIICNVVKFDWKTRRKVPITIVEMRKVGQALHAAAKKLIECAKINDLKDTKHKEAATRILLLASARSLFAADVCCHKNCYAAFTGGAWHREENVKEADNLSDCLFLKLRNSLIQLKIASYVEARCILLINFVVFTRICLVKANDQSI